MKRFKSSSLPKIRLRLISIVAAVSIGVGGNIMPARAAETSRDTTSITSDSDDNDRSDLIEVTVKGEYIYITTSRTVVVRLYSILGQLITQQSVQAGTTRIKAPARGVYILRAGTVTRRVTVN